MDYTGILKRAWNVTWKYKILWLFGLFAGGMGGGISSNSNGSSNRVNTGQGTSGLPSGTAQQFAQFAERSLPVVVALIVLLVVIGLVWWVLSIAAKGGLVHLVNEAEEGRPVRAGDGWRIGFSKWFRLFGIWFVAGFLPALVFVVIVLVVVFASVGGAAGLAGLARGSSAGLAALVPALAGGCCFLLIFALVFIVISVVLTIVMELAVRYAVLRDARVFEALGLGWSDLRAKRGAFLMYLIQWGIYIAYSIVVFVVALILVVPGVLIIFVGSWPVGLLMILFAVLILMVPSAAYGAFYHAAWTIFFRRMTGAEPVRAATLPTAAPGSGYPGSDAAFPPPPSAGYAPPAPPAPPAGAYAPPEADDSLPLAPWQTPPEPEVPAPWHAAAAQGAGDPWKAANELPDDPDAPGGGPSLGG